MACPRQVPDGQTSHLLKVQVHRVDAVQTIRAADRDHWDTGADGRTNTGVIHGHVHQEDPIDPA